MIITVYISQVYLNVDCAVQGLGFFAGSTPQLQHLLLEVIKQVFEVIIRACANLHLDIILNIVDPGI